jgi:hypothetical protein
MSISGILSNNYHQLQLAAATSPYQQQLKQLSQALQSGNVSAAQSDFAALQKAFSQPSTSASSTASTSNLLAQAFNQLDADLQSGNLSAAQKDFATVQQDIQSQGSPAASHFRHHHRLGGGGGDSTTQNSLLQDLNQVAVNQVGQSLTSSNLSGAQKAYSTLQQQLQQFAFGGGALSTQASALQAQPPLSLVA